MTIYSVQAQTLGVIGDNVESYAGSGSSSDPFRYLFDSNSKITWKHLSNIKEKAYKEIYEKRQGNTPEGRLLYSWTFSGADITTPEGPYFLGINFYSGDSVSGLKGGSNSRYFSLACKRELPGPATISLYVGDYYKEDAVLMLYYYGGYDPSVIHGSAPVTDRNEIRKEDSLKKVADGLLVRKGYVEFRLRHGGNYFLTEGLDEKTEQVGESTGGLGIYNDNKAGIGENNTSVFYTEEVSLGRIDRLFHNENIAKAIAESLSKDTSDKITQADLNGIKKLYITDCGLKSLEDLSMTEFGGVESLILSGNRLKTVPILYMPKLQYIDISNNELEEAGNLAILGNLEVILLQNNKISSIFDFSAYPRLLSINLSNNEIVTISRLSSASLVYLNLGNNKLETLSGLEEVPKLEFIDLSGNQLQKMPDFMVCRHLNEIITKQDKDNSRRHKLDLATEASPAFILMCLCLIYIIRRRKASWQSL